jgi:hypothetical protein
MKDDTKQNKNKNNNNNEHKQYTIKGKKIFTYQCVSSIIASWKKSLPSQMPNNTTIFIHNICNNIEVFHK